MMKTLKTYNQLFEALNIKDVEKDLDALVDTIAIKYELGYQRIMLIKNRPEYFVEKNYEVIVDFHFEGFIYTEKKIAYNVYSNFRKKIKELKKELSFYTQEEFYNIDNDKYINLYMLICEYIDLHNHEKNDVIHATILKKWLEKIPQIKTITKSREFNL